MLGSVESIELVPCQINVNNYLRAIFDPDRGSIGNIVSTDLIEISITTINQTF